MIHQGDLVLLLLPWRVDVSEEEGNVVSTDNGKDTVVVEFRATTLLSVLVSSFKCLFALVDDRIRELGAISSTCLAFPCLNDALTDLVDLFLRYEVVRCIERRRCPR